MVLTIVDTMRLTHTLKDTTAKIEMDNKLEQLVFKKAEDFHTQVLSGMSKYDLLTSERDCIELLTKKVQYPTYAK